MATREASAFFWVGNHPGLDLLNTEAVDGAGARLELVPGWPELVDWTVAAGLIESELGDRCRSVAERRGQDVLSWFRSLRSSLRSVIESDRDASGDLDAVVADVPVHLSSHPDQRRTLPVAADGPLDQLRLALAVAALEASRLDRSRIRRCGSERCVLVFLDTSRNRSRRWCSMAACGNRAKAGTHYRRGKRDGT